MNREDYEKFLNKKVNVIVETNNNKELFFYGIVSEINDDHFILEHYKFGITKVRFNTILRIYFRDRELEDVENEK